MATKKSTKPRSETYVQAYEQCLIGDKRKTKFCRKMAREAEKRAKLEGRVGARVAGLGALASTGPYTRRRTNEFKSNLEVHDHGDRRFFISNAEDPDWDIGDEPVYVTAYPAGTEGPYAGEGEDTVLNEGYFDSVDLAEEAIRSGKFRGARGKKRRGLRGDDEDAERALFRDESFTPSADQVASRALGRAAQAIRDARSRGGCGVAIEGAVEIGEGRAAARIAGANASTLAAFEELGGRVTALIRDECGCTPTSQKKRNANLPRRRSSARVFEE